MSDAVMVPREAIEALAREYRPSMDKDTVHDWGADAASMLKRLAASPPVGGWEDISTAPKDGTEVLVLAGRKVIRLGWYFKPSSRTEGWCDENGKRIYPTHWMPLPPPPSVSTGSRPQEAVPTEGPGAAAVEPSDRFAECYENGAHPNCHRCYRGEVPNMADDSGFWVEMGAVAGGANEHGLRGWIELIEHHPDGTEKRREYIATDSPVYATPQPADGCSSNEGAA